MANGECRDAHRPCGESIYPFNADRCGGHRRSQRVRHNAEERNANARNLLRLSHGEQPSRPDEVRFELGGLGCSLLEYLLLQS